MWKSQLRSQANTAKMSAPTPPRSAPPPPPRRSGKSMHCEVLATIPALVTVTPLFWTSFVQLLHHRSPKPFRSRPLLRLVSVASQRQHEPAAQLKPACSSDSTRKHCNMKPHITFINVRCAAPAPRRRPGAPGAPPPPESGVENVAGAHSEFEVVVDPTRQCVRVTASSAIQMLPLRHR